MDDSNDLLPNFSTFVYDMDSLIVAYCRDNIYLAEEISKNLGLIGIPFEHVTNMPGELPGTFARALLAQQDPVLCLVTKNFLCNLNCMTGMAFLIRDLQKSNRVLFIVADGKSPDLSLANGTSKEATEFEKVSDAVYYINYWQNKYFEITRKLDYAHPSEKPQMMELQAQYAKVIEEVPDVISLLKDTQYIRWEAFVNNHYELFFKKFGIIEWHSQYQDLLANKSKASQQQEINITPNQPNINAPELLNNETPADNPIPEPLPDTTSVFDQMENLIREISEEEEAFHKGLILPKEDEHDEQKLPPTISMDICLPKDESHKVIDALPTITQALSLPTPQGGIEKPTPERVLPSKPAANHENLIADFERAKKLLYDDKDANKAQIELEKLFDTGFPEDILYNLLGEVAFVKGEFVFARNCWDRVTNINPKFPFIFQKLGNLTKNHFNGFKKTSAEYYKRAIQENPENPALYFELAAVSHLFLDKDKKAIKYYERGLLLDPDNVAAWRALAGVYRKLQDDTAAQRCMDKAAQLEKVTMQQKETHVVTPTIITETIEEPQKLEQKAVITREIAPKALNTVLITGATSGIGLATARLFAEKGCKLILTGRRRELLMSAEEMLSKLNPATKVKLLNFDVREAETAKAALNSLPDDWQDIDILINNAGLAKGFDPIHEGKLEHWETMIDTNIKGLLYITRLVAPLMVARRSGHIINVGSSAGKEVYPKGNVYCATKFAVEALTKSMRLDLYKYNIRVSQVSPGHVEETEFAATRFDGDTEKASIYSDFQPLKAEDVADAIFYIATRPAHVNIQDIYMFGLQQAGNNHIDRSGR